MKQVGIGLAILALVIGLPVACTLGVAAIGEQAAASCVTSTAAPLAIDPADLPEVPGLDPGQVRNATIIIEQADAKHLGVDGARVALITAIAESGLRNLANAGTYLYPAGGSSVMTEEEWAQLAPVVATSVNYPNDGVAPGDWDSIGMFQDRLSTGHGGTGSLENQIANLLDPAYTSARFLTALSGVADWQHMDPGAAAQTIQRSAFPDRYDEHLDVADELLTELSGVAAAGNTCGAAWSTAPVSADGWTAPITAYKSLSSGFGMRVNPVTGIYTLHEGQDFAAPRGTPIYAAAAGTVTAAGSAGTDDGLYWVVVDHGGGVVTRYLHEDPDGILVTVGQQVTAGQEIARVGNTGNSTGPHLHFEVRIDGTPIEPLGYLAQHGIDIAPAGSSSGS